MSGAGPALGSVLAALALHVAVLARLDLPQGASGEGGTGGEAVAALQAAPGDLVALIADWDQAPAPLPTRQAPPQPATDAAPSLPAPDPAAARLPRARVPMMPGRDRAALAAAPPPDQPRPQAPAAEVPPAPVVPPLPETLPPPLDVATPDAAPAATPPPAPRPARQAADEGQGASAGQGGEIAAASTTQTARQAALAAWGAAVRAAVERHQRLPAGSSAAGVVTLVLEVARDGALNGVNVSVSSGIAALDAAALAAVRAAAPFAPAPAALRDPAYALRLTLRYTH